MISPDEINLPSYGGEILLALEATCGAADRLARATGGGAELSTLWRVDATIRGLGVPAVLGHSLVMEVAVDVAFVASGPSASLRTDAGGRHRRRWSCCVVNTLATKHRLGVTWDVDRCKVPPASTTCGSLCLTRAAGWGTECGRLRARRRSRRWPRPA